MLTGVGLTAKRVATHVGMVHEAGHPEPWLIAMSDAPATARTFDYSLRWGIEAMFFRLEDSRPVALPPDRVGLLPVAEIVLHAKLLS
jgi:hypothetical protein